MTFKRKTIYISIILFITIIAGIASYIYYTLLPPQEVAVAIKEAPIPKPELLYGVPRDSFIINQGTVRNGQFLSDILLAQGVDLITIDKVFCRAQPHFDFRRMRVGNKYVFMSPKDSTRYRNRFVYEIDKINYLTVEIGTDTIIPARVAKTVTRIDKQASGQIQSSMWKTIQENNLPPMLAVSLSEIYAWTVDFFGIEKGDFFKVIYQEDFVENESIGIGKIHAALFSHKKRAMYAFAFEEDSTWNFFDEKGQSLRKAFLKAPLQFARISSHFSHSRLHPILKIRRPHHGIDYAAPTGTPVHSIGDGHVITKGWDPKGGGNYLKIKHNSVYTTVYMHLSGFAKGLTTGQHVQQGQLIGYVGKTGLASGPHLDFRVFQNNKPIDPLKLESPPVDPIKSDKMDEYLKWISPLKNQLDTISIKTHRKLLQ
ncbi:MAG: M23 family metallopeptidase [Marinilabiliaceae bacterium]|nr:M23 family metallopeptidase [Marinilabiliaceae bacterium]